jgi:hypothetical protein
MANMRVNMLGYFVAYFIFFIEDVIHHPHFTFFSESIMKLNKKFRFEASAVV